MFKRNSLGRVSVLATALIITVLCMISIPAYSVESSTLKLKPVHYFYKDYRGKGLMKYSAESFVIEKKGKNVMYIEVGSENWHRVKAYVDSIGKDYWSGRTYREVILYNYAGKKKKHFKISNDKQIPVMKLSKKNVNVYYYRFRVLYDESGDGKKVYPISQWSKPIYCWGQGKKAIKIKALEVSPGKIKKIVVKTPKSRGIKKYKISLDGESDDYIESRVHKKKTVKAGRNAVFKNIVLDKDLVKKKLEVLMIGIDPVFSKKGDKLGNSGQYTQGMILRISLKKTK